MRRSASLAGIVLALFALSACAGADADPGDGPPAAGMVIGKLDQKAPVTSRWLVEFLDTVRDQLLLIMPR